MPKTASASTAFVRRNGQTTTLPLWQLATEFPFLSAELGGSVPTGAAIASVPTFLDDTVSPPIIYAVNSAGNGYSAVGGITQQQKDTLAAAVTAPSPQSIGTALVPTIEPFGTYALENSIYAGLEGLANGQFVRAIAPASGQATFTHNANLSGNGQNNFNVRTGDDFVIPAGSLTVFTLMRIGTSIRIIGAQSQAELVELLTGNGIDNNLYPNADQSRVANLPVNTTQELEGTVKTANNLSDVSAPVARANLDVYSQAEVDAQIANGTIGTVQLIGEWNASTNSPAIPTAAAGNKGHYYIVTTAGGANIDGIADWDVGDWIISDGSTWFKVDNTSPISSVNGRTGAVVLTQADIGLGNVQNTSDAAKPVSTAQQAALDDLASEIITVSERAKLAGIESNATADQTGSEIKVLYEAEDDTNAFTNAEKTKVGNAPEDTNAALSGKQNTSEKNQPNGYAGLDADGKISASVLRSARNIVNAEDYGTFTTPSEALDTLNAAEAALSPGDILQLPGQTMETSGSWVFTRPDCILRGKKGVTRLLRNATAPLGFIMDIQASAERMRMEDVQFDGNNQLTSNAGSNVIVGTKEFSAFDCDFDNADGSAGYGSGLQIVGQDGAASKDGRYHLERCRARGNGDVGILIQYADFLSARALTCNDNGKNGFRLQSFTGSLDLAYGLDVDGLTCLDNASTGAIFGDPLIGDVFTQGSIVLGHGEPENINSRIANVLAEGNGGYGLTVSGEYVQVITPILRRNATSSTQIGFFAGLLLNALYAEVINPLIEGNTGGYGIDAGGSLKSKILGGVVRNNHGHGILLEASAEIAVRGVLAEMNTLAQIFEQKSGGTGLGDFYDLLCKDNIIEGNEIRYPRNSSVITRPDGSQPTHFPFGIVAREKTALRLGPNRIVPLDYPQDGDPNDAANIEQISRGVQCWGPDHKIEPQQWHESVSRTITPRPEGSDQVLYVPDGMERVDIDASFTGTVAEIRPASWYNAINVIRDCEVTNGGAGYSKDVTVEFFADAGFTQPLADTSGRVIVASSGGVIIDIRMVTRGTDVTTAFARLTDNVNTPTTPATTVCRVGQVIQEDRTVTLAANGGAVLSSGGIASLSGDSVAIRSPSDRNVVLPARGAVQLAARDSDWNIVAGVGYTSVDPVRLRATDMEGTSGTVTFDGSTDFPVPALQFPNSGSSVSKCAYIVDQSQAKRELIGFDLVYAVDSDGGGDVVFQVALRSATPGTRADTAESAESLVLSVDATNTNLARGRLTLSTPHPEQNVDTVMLVSLLRNASAPTDTYAGQLDLVSLEPVYG